MLNLKLANKIQQEIAKLPPLREPPKIPSEKYKDLIEKIKEKRGEVSNQCPRWNISKFLQFESFEDSQESMEHAQLTIHYEETYNAMEDRIAKLEVQVKHWKDKFEKEQAEKIELQKILQRITIRGRIQNDEAERFREMAVKTLPSKELMTLARRTRPLIRH
jgi:hypothetical protein